MFPSINRIFRKKEIAEIEALKIPTEEKQVLQKYTIDCRNTNLDDENNIIVQNLEDKLNVMGVFFANINNKEVSGIPKFTEYINKKANSFYEELESKMASNSTLCEFNEDNGSNNP